MFRGKDEAERWQKRSSMNSPFVCKATNFLLRLASVNSILPVFRAGNNGVPRNWGREKGESVSAT